MEPMVDPAIETDALTKHFGDVKAVQALDLIVDTGEVFGFLGLNGAGKTTTVRMLAGSLPPTRGAARVAGYDPQSGDEALAQEIGVVFGENITPEPSFSPIRYLRHFGSLYGLSRERTDERARQLFDVLDLEGEERPIGDLSGGNKRKVEIARALLHGLRILFLDEPTRELDIPSKREMWRFFRALVEGEEVTVFLSSHDIQEIAALCDRIGIIREGKLTWEGRPDELAEGDAGLVDALSDRLEGRGTAFEVA
jgi:ABC-type multidrug transport system ATPase subunit